MELSNTRQAININEAPASTAVSAVCWGAIFAGAAASAALSLILLILGTGLGLSSVSPWANSGISGSAFGLSTILWITLTALAASAIGGYIAGRLRTRWVTTADADEIYFRDTAHGFLAWAVATLFTAAILTSSISTILGHTAQAGANIAGGTLGAAAAAGAAGTEATDQNQYTTYYIDSLFRKAVSGTDNSSGQPATDSNEAKTEVARIYINALSSGSLPPEDVKYAGQVIAKNTGLTEADAEKRVQDIYQSLQKRLADAETAAREAADKARKITAYGSLWLFISLLIGAFFASFAAITGGRQRDN